jgi:RanBP1 domain
MRTPHYTTLLLISSDEEFIPEALTLHVCPFISQDYVKYAGEITDKYGDQVPLAPAATSSTAKKEDAAPTVVPKPALSTTVSSSFPAFTAAKPSAPEAPKQEAAPLFSFGASAAAEPAKPSTGTASASASASAAPFSFNLGAASASSTAAVAPALAPFGSFDKPVFPISDSVKSAPPSFPAFSLTGAGAGAGAATAAAAPSSSSSTEEKKSAFNWNVPGLGSTIASGSGQSAFGAPFSFASSGSGGFGGAPAGGFGGFSSTGADAGAGGAGGEGGEDGDDEGEPILEPEKVYRNPEDKDEKLIECDSKMHRFDTSKAAGSSKGEWVEYGKGVFSITKCAETGKKRMLVRNLVGKIIFNASFYKGMKVDKTPKGQFSFGAVVDSSGTLKSFLLKVGEANREKVLKIMKDAIAELD